MKIALTGGGTGGHIYPSLAIGRYAQQQDPTTELLYIGSDLGLERDIVPKAGLRFESVRVTGFRRSLSLSNFKTIWNFLTAVQKSKKLLKQFKPDIVIGTGGYVCGPVIYAAAKLGIPTLIHEQNVLPGLTNRFLSKHVDGVAVSFPGGESYFPHAKRVTYTGNPRATEVVHADAKAASARLGIPAGQPLVVFVGGSRGARALTEAMVALAPLWTANDPFHILYVTGAPYFDSTVARVEQDIARLNGKLTVVPYIDQFPDVLAASSLVIGRSGASSIAELTAIGVPSIQVPSPNVTNNHQEANARRLSEAGAAQLVLERELKADALIGTIRDLFAEPKKLDHMREAAKQFGKPDSAAVIHAYIQQLLR
jgi:UDP-N-acetylglucosamine--N-acetylmuramyl-(pentapeptide) pyrophosphoryl-undecaprenol N-acetylglucosamine transferase